MNSTTTDSSTNTIMPYNGDPGVVLAQDMEALKLNSITLATAAGSYNANPSDVNNQTALGNAIAGESVSVSAVGTDIAGLISSSPNVAVISKLVGVAGFLAGAKAFVNDGTEFKNEFALNHVKASTVLSLMGDLATLTGSGAQMIVELASLPEEAALSVAAYGLYGVTAVLGGAALSATGSVLSYVENKDGGTLDPVNPDDIVKIGNIVDYGNGLKGLWSDNLDQTASTYQTYNASTGQVVYSVTVPIETKQSLSSGGMVLTAPDGEQEVIGANGLGTHIQNGTMTAETQGTDRVFTSAVGAVQSSQNGTVDVNTQNGDQKVTYNNSAPNPYQSTENVDTSGVSPSTSTTIKVDNGSHGSDIVAQGNNADGSKTNVDTLSTQSGDVISQEHVAVDPSGDKTSDVTNLSNGDTFDTYHEYSSPGVEAYYIELLYDPSGNFGGYAEFNPTGGYLGGDGYGAFAGLGNFGDGGGYASGGGGYGGGTGYGGSGSGGGYGYGGGGSGGGGGYGYGGGGYGYGGGGGYGGGYEFTSTTSLKSTDIGAIAQMDKSQLKAPGLATAAHRARLQSFQLTDTNASHHQVSTKAQYEGAHWASKTITWSIASTTGPKGAPFSSYIGKSYLAQVQKAFAAWGAAAGITFTQVADSSAADIRLGFGSLNMATTGVSAYTSYRDKKGVMTPGAVIRLEDPSQDPLVSNGSGGYKYSKSGIDLSQLLEHEIGHAIGLANNNDKTSVLYYKQATGNLALSSADKAAAFALYNVNQRIHNPIYIGPPTPVTGPQPVNAASGQLAQALAAFAPSSGSLNSSARDAGISNSLSPMLVANRHMAVA